MTDFMALADKTEAELNKMTKGEIVTAIRTNTFMAKHHKTQAEQLQKQIDQNATNERAACVMLAAFVGKEIAINEYSGLVESKSLNILELVGLVTAKCVEVSK